MKVSTVSSDQIWLAVEGHVSAVSEYCASVTMLSRKELTNVIVLVYSISPVSGTMKQINSRSCLHTFLSRLKLRTQQKAVCWTFHMSSYPSWRSSAWGIFSSVSKTEVLFSFLFFFFVRYRLRRGRQGARKRDRPVEAERTALPVSRLWQGVRQTADPLQTPVPAHRWARTSACVLASVCSSMWTLAAAMALPKSANKSY